MAAKIRDASDLLVKAIRTRVRPYGLSLNQYRLLREVWEDEGVTQRVITARMKTSEPATVATVDALVAKSLIRRVVDADDRRRSLIFLTAKGARLRDEILDVNDDLNAAALAGLAREEREQFAALLDRVVDNLTPIALGED